jgi:hypothetical protein
MRKLFSILAATLFATTMFAATAPKATFDFKDQNWNFPTTATTEAKSFVNGDQTIVVSDGFKGMTTSSTDPTIKGVLFGKKNKTISLPAFSFRTEKILVYYVDGAGSANTKHNIFVGETAVSTEEVGCKVTTEKSYSTFEITEAKRDAGTVYILKVTSDHNMQVSKIEVYEDESTPASVYAPTFDPAAETFEVDVTIALACATEGASIFYTTNGTEPATTAGASTYEYTNPFTITETTTIKAIAVKGADKSAVAEKTYTKLVVNQYEVKEAIDAGLNKGDLIKVRGVVTNMAAKGKNFATYGSLKIYVKDATGAEGEFQFFNCVSLNEAKFETTVPAYDATSEQWADFTSVTDADGHTLKVGDTIVAKGKYELYNSTYELQQGCYLLEIKEGQAPQPEVIEMTYTTTDGLQWLDETADQGWWQIILGGVLSLSNTGTVASPAGTYAAADLDASYSYVVSGSTKVTFTEGSITVAVDENEVVTIKGQLVGTDGNTYKFDLTFNPDEYVVDPYKYDEDQDFTATFSSYSVKEVSDGVFSIMAISDGKGVDMTAFLPTGATAEQAAGKTFPINDSGDEQTVAAGYYDGTEGVMSSYAALINTSYQITNVWYLVSGTATVDANLNITVAAKNSKGRNINIQLNYPSTGIQDVKTVEKLVKYIQNGQIMINVNGAQYNVNGARVK